MDGVPFSNPVVAELSGTYEVDPSLTLTGLDYAGGDGVVGDRAPSVVPEPSTWAMILAGFGGLGFLAHRRRNKPPTIGRQIVAEN